MKQTKYVKIAVEIERAIRSNTLQPGSRLPSVRKLMAQQQVSLSTATSALQRLEEAGLIEPRPRSGYYVKAITAATPRNESMRTAREPPDAGAPAPDLFPAERLKRIAASLVRRHPDLAARVPREAGQTALARQLARRSAEYGCFLREADIVVTQGDTEALAIALRAVAKGGDEILVQAPLDPWASRVIESLDLRPVPLPQEGGALVAAVSRMLEGGSTAKTMLINPSFHHPTGRILSIRDKRALLRVCSKFELALIEDDRFGDLQHEGPRPLPIKSFDTEGIVIYFTSCCRTIAPGLQIGWIAAGPSRLPAIRALKRVSSAHVNELSQLVLAEFLARGSHTPHLRRLRSRLRERTERVRSAIGAALDDANRVPMSGGYSHWLPLRKAPSESAGAEYAFRWPVLFDPAAPVVAFGDGGVQVNASRNLGTAELAALSDCCRALKDLVAIS